MNQTAICDERKEQERESKGESQFQDSRRNKENRIKNINTGELAMP